MTVPTPREPESLPEGWLNSRKIRECKWETNDRAGDKKLREIQAWAKEQLVGVFMAQELGGDANDPAFLDRVDALYNPIRNALTRQDLLRGFLLVVEQEAIEEANNRMREFRRELGQITDPDIF